MSNTLELSLGYSATVVVRLRTGPDQIWDTTVTALTTYDSADIANYQIATTQLGTNSGIYTVTIPATLPAGIYSLDWIPVEWSSDPVYAAYTTVFEWDGSAIITAVSPQHTIKKNAALAAFPFKMVLASDNKTPATGLTVAATRSIDGAVFASCANSPASEVSGGWYAIDLAASDLNGDTIALEFDGGATANVLPVTIVTQP